MNNSYFIVPLVLLFSLIIFPVLAQEVESLITIKTDKASYVEGETIVISGQVSTVIVNDPLTMQIFHKGNVVDIASFNVAEDGTFTHTIIAEGPLWDNEGEYVIRAYYGGDITETSFDFIINSDIPKTTNIWEVDAGSSGIFDVKYTIKGGTVKDIVVDPEIFGLIVIINSTDDGTIFLNLPRDSIDAKTQDGEDDTYIVLIDGIEVVPQETKENGSRILTIAFEEGDSDIEIIGTNSILNQQTGDYSGNGSGAGILDSSTFRIIPQKPNVGSTIRVTGSDFAPLQEFEFYLDNTKLGKFLTDDTGYFVTTMSIPENSSAERVEFTVRDSSNNEKTTSVRLGDAEDRIPDTNSHSLTAEIEKIPEPIISVNVDLPSYTTGDVISISGTIENFDSNLINLMIIDPEGITIWKENVLIKNNGNFSTLVIAGGENWFVNGRYFLTATYSDTISRTIFSYYGDKTEPDSDPKSTDKRVSSEKDLGIAPFVDVNKDPRHYVERYQNEPDYKEWFDSNYPQYDSIYEAVGLEKPNQEKVPNWIKNNAEWWAEGQIDDDTFLNGVGYLVKEKIIDVPASDIQCNEDEIIIDGMCIVPDPLEEPPEPKMVPDWIRNNAKWWAEGQITQDDFVTGIEFLVKQGIIKVN